MRLFDELLVQSVRSARDASQLLPGSPLDLRTIADQLGAMADAARDGGNTLRNLSLGTWYGESANAFQERLAAHRMSLTTAFQSYRVVASTLLYYAAIVERGQEEVWEAVTAFRRLDSEFTTVISDGLTPAQQVQLDRVRTAELKVQIEAQAAVDAIHKVMPADQAPAPMKHVEASFCDRAGKSWSSFWHGAADDLTSTGKMIWYSSWESIIIDRNGWWAYTKNRKNGAWELITHPNEIPDVALDLDMWRSDPFKAAGELAPDLILALFTDGLGGLAARSVKVSAKVRAKAAAKEVAKTGSKDLVKGEVKEVGKSQAENALENLLQNPVADHHTAAKNDKTGAYVGQKADQFTAEQLATPTPGDVTIVFKLPDDLTNEEVRQALDYIRAANAARLDGVLSPDGRAEPTKSPGTKEGRTLRDDASDAAARERRRASRAGDSYSGYQAGHGPDTAWTGTKIVYEWQPQTARINGTVLAQVARFTPAGTMPTIFQAEFADGSTYPDLTGD